MASSQSVTALPLSPKIQKRQSRTRQRILDISAHLFLARGFENVSVEEILDAAEIARSSFYRFFSNREDLLTNITRPVFERGIEDLKQIDATEPQAIVDAVLDAYLDLWDAGPDALRVSTRIGGKHFYLFDDVHSVYRDRVTALMRAVEPSGILLNDNGDYSARLIARSAIPIMEVYCKDPDFKELFHRTMRGLLLREEPSS